MKSLVQTLFAIALATLISASPAYALVEAATTSGVVPTTSLKQIDDLKERLATKVAQLRQLERRALFGTVKTISISSITVETKTKDVKIELQDDIKVIQIIKGKRTTLATSDISKGDIVAIFGNYDTTLDLMNAKIIFIQDPPLDRIAGVITTTDKIGFTVTITPPQGPSVLIDIEKFTKAFTWDKAGGIVKSGFSKIAVGDTVHVLKLPVPKKENRVSAYRILDIGNVSGNLPTPTPEPTKISSPSATPKAKVLKPTATPTPTPSS